MDSSKPDEITPESSKGKTIDRICPNCGSNDLFLTSSIAKTRISGIFDDGRPLYECKGCGTVFSTPIEVYEKE